MKQHIKTVMTIIGSVMILCGVLSLLWHHIVSPLLAYANDPVQFQAWLTSFGPMAIVIMIVCIMLKVIFPMLPGKVLEIAAGYCFGFWHGLWIVLLANALGTWCVRMLVRQFGQSIILRFLDQQTIEHFPVWENKQRFTLLVWLTYLIPGTPKDALTYVISLSPMRTPNLIFITTTARIFTVSAGVFSGSALLQKQYEIAFWITLLFLVISALGLYIYRHCILKRPSNH